MVGTEIALKSRFALILRALKSRFHCISYSWWQQSAMLKPQIVDFFFQVEKCHSFNSTLLQSCFGGVGRGPKGKKGTKCGNLTIFHQLKGSIESLASLESLALLVSQIFETKKAWLYARPTNQSISLHKGYY